MNYILFDGTFRDNLLPFTFTRPVADIRIGILTIREKWETWLKTKTYTYTEPYLSKKYPCVLNSENIFINASYLPNELFIKALKKLNRNEALYYKDDLVAYNSSEIKTSDAILEFKRINFNEELFILKHTWDIFSKNDQAITDDFKLITHGRQSQSIPPSVNVINPELIFIEAGASLQYVTLNAATGPIYIGKNAEIMEGSVIRGPFALGEQAVIKLNSKIYGPTTVGPYSKIGGEVNNSVIFGYTNKGHDGFLGNSVLGEWCNLGADTNNSNLKNNYAEVRLWDYKTERFEKTGLQFCGLMMGDHSKCGINTMFNTGTVVGVSANIFGSGFPRNFIPSFSWGGSNGFSVYLTNKALEVAQVVTTRRNIQLSEDDIDILEHVFELTKLYRKNFV